jgi:Zn finger protein HypA/HybF involved in hydrogenase expression
MKNVLIVLTAIALFGLIACEGPAGPAGKDGATGKDGVAGKDAGFVYFDGFKADLKCSSCHNADTDTVNNVAARSIQWANSLHGSGTASEENRVSCVECHSTEGFIMKAKGITIASDIVNVTPPNCFACHSPHAKGDFSLRTTASVSLTSNIIGVNASTFNVGNGNLCVACHRPRPITASATTMLPDPTKTAMTDTLKIASSRWYGHYGVQGQILIGAGAFQFQGTTTYGTTSQHSTMAPISTNGCITCHMADFTPANAYGNKIGGHTMAISYIPEGSTTTVEMLNGCKTCHSSITKLDYNSKVTTFKANLDTLKKLLVAKNWIDTLDALKATSTAPLKIVPASRGGALFNYMMLIHDGSKGVHNPIYANDVVRASIAEMRK